MNTPSSPTTKPPEMALSSQIATRDVMADAASHRAIQEVQAALVVAKRFPRDEFKAIASIKVACQRYELAEMAEYEYERGGTKITGPTIDLLKAIAKRWGNIEYGWAELERKIGSSIIRAYAWDMETNARSEMVFTVKHWRDTKSGGYAVTDERDIYEVTANFASRRVRACLEAVVDGDVIQTAVEECRRTLRGQNTEPLVDRVRKMVSAFGEIGVNAGMIQDRLGNKLEAVSENQLALLRRIYKSIKDGVGDVKDFFSGAGITTQTPPAEKQPLPKPKKGAGKEAEKPEADDGLGPVESQAAAAIAGPQAELQKLVADAGFDLTIFGRWGEETGNVPNGTSLTSFAEVPADITKRLLRASKGLLDGLKRTSGK